MKLPIPIFTLCSFLTVHISANDFVVINTNDSGPGSLRAAMDLVNASADVATISFNIPAPGIHVISPARALPFLTNAVTIDGYSQPGASRNTLADGDNAVILIQIATNLILQGKS